jgi:hypothetical protein
MARRGLSRLSRDNRPQARPSRIPRNRNPSSKTSDEEKIDLPEANSAGDFPQAMPIVEQNPAVDSDSIAQPVGPDSTIEEIIAFGRAANARVQHGAELEAEGRVLQFHDTLNVILALHWAKLRIEDDDDVPRKAKPAAFVSAAKKMGVARTYAYDLLKLYKHVSALQSWGEAYRRELGEYPSPAKMMHHCGVGLRKPTALRGKPMQRDKFIERMQRENERLRATLSDCEARESALRSKLKERDAEVASLRAQLAERSERSGSDETDFRSLESQPGPAVAVGDSTSKQPVHEREHRPRYIITPEDLWDYLRREYPGIVDLFPHPLPLGYDAFSIERWPNPTYANVPFLRADELHGRSLLDWVRIGNKQNQRFGTTIVMAVPSTDAINLLLDAGAVGRGLGRLRWLDAETRQPWPNPAPSALFVLRGHNVP